MNTLTASLGVLVVVGYAFKIVLLSVIAGMARWYWFGDWFEEHRRITWVGLPAAVAILCALDWPRTPFEWTLSVATGVFAWVVGTRWVNPRGRA